MIILNINNVEDLIFYDSNIKKLLPEFTDMFRQWAFTKEYVGFRQLTKRTICDFLEALQESDIVILERYFGTKVSIDKMDYRTVKNVELDPDYAELEIQEDGFNFSIYRNKDRLYATFWR